MQKKISNSDSALILTTQEVYQYKNAISNLKKDLYQEKKNSATSDIEVTLVDAIESFSSNDTKETYLNSLEEKIDNLKKMQITIPVIPNAKIINEIKKVFLDSKTNLELVIETDPSIVCGTIVSFQGHYQNNSLKSYGL